MKQYQDLLRRVLQTGSRQSNRTGIDTFFVPGEMMKFDLTEGFPVITTRKYDFKKAVAEQIGFINAFTSAADFRALGCPFWDANANENEAWLNNPNRDGHDDLGTIYGFQARNWVHHDYNNENGDLVLHDQFASVINELLINPTSRRLLVSHWRPDQFELMALPPCHVMYQFIADTQNRELSMTLYMRSNDLFLGAPANIVEYAWLLEVVAHVIGYKAKWLTYFIGDAHIYANHVDQALELINRTPHKAPKLVFKRDYFAEPADGPGPVEWIESLRPDDFELEGYHHHAAIKAAMAV